MNLDTGAAVNTFRLNFGEQEIEDSIGRPVVTGFLMVELGSFYDENGLSRSLNGRLT